MRANPLPLTRLETINQSQRTCDPQESPYSHSWVCNPWNGWEASYPQNVLLREHPHDSASSLSHAAQLAGGEVQIYETGIAWDLGEAGHLGVYTSVWDRDQQLTLQGKQKQRRGHHYQMSLQDRKPLLPLRSFLHHENLSWEPPGFWTLAVSALCLHLHNSPFIRANSEITS